jgi:hypothetical protein
VILKYLSEVSVCWGREQQNAAKSKKQRARHRHTSPPHHELLASTSWISLVYHLSLH